MDGVLTALSLATLLLWQEPAPAPTRPEFDLTVRLAAPSSEAAENSSDLASNPELGPVGWRILRGPKALAHLSAAAWMERPQVQRGKFRSWPADKDQTSIRLFPTPGNDQYEWRIVIYTRIDMSAFRVASEAFRQVPIGVSECFAIPPTGGEAEIEVELRPTIRVLPNFNSKPAPDGQSFRFVFSYGPQGRPPRYARGQWSGQGPLPLHLSPFAEARPATLELDWLSSPAPLVLGPKEFRLKADQTEVRFDALPQTGTLTARIADAMDWSAAVGFRDQENEVGVYLAPIQKVSTRCTIPSLRYGQYFLLEHQPDSDFKPRRALVDFQSAEQLVDLEKEVKSHKQALHFQGWPDQSGKPLWLRVRTMWGPFLWQRSDVNLQQTELKGLVVNLPSGPGFHHEAYAIGLHEDGETTTVHWFGSASKSVNGLHFELLPTAFEVDGYEDDVDYTLRLMRDPHGPKFPPKLWMDTPMSAHGLDYMPMPFRNSLMVYGLPEGGYEASLWGLDRESGEVEELSYHYPFSD